MGLYIMPECLGRRSCYMDYLRSFQSFGESLALISIKQTNYSYGLKYHLIFQNGYKPPIDIAINPDNGVVQSVKFFIQNERIERNNRKIITTSANFFINIPETVDESNYMNEENALFRCWINENDIWIVRVEYFSDQIFSSAIDVNNYILHDNNRFLGLLIKNVTKKELAILLDSN